MKKFYIKKDATLANEHELHQDGCIWLLPVSDYLFLGVFRDRFEATKEARKLGYNVEKYDNCCIGCYRSVIF